MTDTPQVVVLFQRRSGLDRDPYDLFWTDAQPGEYTKAFDTLEATRRPPESYIWESTGLASMAEKPETLIPQAEKRAKKEQRDYRLVTVENVGLAVRYRVVWQSQ